MQPRTLPHTERARADWYRLPVVWLGALVFAASLAGCVWMIVLGASHADEPLTTSGTIMKMPIARPEPADTPAQAEP